MNTLITIVMAIGVAIEIWGLVITLSAHGRLDKLEYGMKLVFIGSATVAAIACVRMVMSCFM